ncbi:hypothetical protein, partial [Klebsiella pneumoniae]|uniref:hypothetical protein n=1 Tax=Klebsiella pneumoniae TaxID=573 RepID=UPI003013A1AF
LKSFLSDLVESVREEADEAKKESEEALRAVGENLTRARGTASRFQVAVQGREEALLYLSAALNKPQPQGKLVVAMFVADTFAALR